MGAAATPGSSRVRTRSEKHQLSRRKSQVVGAVGFLCAAALPFALWHRAISIVAADFRFEAEYLVTGWTGYGMIAIGLLFLLPVVLSIGRASNSRLYLHARNAYAGWGVSLYVMGAALASQVAQIANSAP